MELGFTQVSREQFLAKYKHVGILALQLPPELEDRPEAAREIEATVAKYLALAGMDVVPSQSYRAAYDTINREVGGIYDPRTGEPKAKLATEVADRARAEFQAREHLDGFVSLRVSVVSANFFAACIRWDGVCDASDGGEVNDTDDSHRIGTMSGSVPALSLHLQIFQAPGRMEYSKYAGIQPMAYVRVFEPLPPLPVARAKKAEPALRQSRDRILQSVHRVALSPIYSDTFKLPEATQKRMLDAVRQELAPLHWEVVDAPDAYAQLVTRMLGVNLFDPYTGRRNEEAISVARQAVSRSIGGKPEPDAILWLSVVGTVATHRKGNAEWDGVTQDALTLGPVVKRRELFTFNPPPNVGGGDIWAVSFQAHLANRDDSLLYRSRGGLELAQRILKPDVVGYRPASVDREDLRASEMFQHPERETMAVHIALRELVLTPEALAAEVGGPAR
ncbi:MAG TPA: hypothetical protein VJP84_15430 [Steroidobacteraceae bacterium]|nr:hypothetical protein [Steroidobacteraceae bacterium]